MIFTNIIWNADPELVRIGSFSLRWYSILLVLSLIISYITLRKMFEREDVPKDILVSYGFFILAGLFIGGRLVHCLAYEPEYYLKYPWDIIKPWRGKLGVNATFTGYRGMSGHGSAIGIILGIVINSLRVGRPSIWMIDRIALFGPLIGFFVRLGNFFNSEILGKSSVSLLAVTFARADNIPRHPVQLYEAFAYLVIFFIVYQYYRKRAEKAKPGAILGLVLILVYCTRFLLEFFKAEQSDVETGMLLNMGHLLSIPFIIAGFILFFRPDNKKQKRIATENL